MLSLARRTFAFGLSFSAVLATSAIAQTKPARPSKQYTIEQFMATITVTGASFSADEKRVLYSSNETGIFNVYSAPIAGGPATPVTRSTTDTTVAVSYFPNDDRVLYTRDQGGNELHHLYVLAADGQEKDLTPGAKLKAGFQGWSPLGDAFWVTTNERDARFFDLYRHDAKTYERTLVYQDDKGYQLGAVSGDGRYLAFAKPNSTADSDLYLWDVQAREMKHLSPHQGMVQFSPEDFDPTSKALYYLTDDGAEFTRVRRYDIASGRHEEVEKADWE